MTKMYKIYDSTRDGMNNVVEYLDAKLKFGKMHSNEFNRVRRDAYVARQLQTALRGATTDGFTLKRAKNLISKYA